MVPQGTSSGNAAPLQSADRRIAAGRATARVEADIERGLAALLARDVAEWVSAGLSLVKLRTVRAVFAGTLDAVPVHVKVFRAGRLSDRARDALRGPRGDREFEQLARLRALGFPAVRPLACGTAIGDGEPRSFVATATVPGARPFTFDHPPAVLHAAGVLLRRLHDAGVLPGDLHPGNLLVDADGGLWLIDLTNVAHRGDASATARAAALAFFCQSLDGGALDRRAEPLASGYRGDDPSFGAAFVRELTLATRRWRARALPAFGRRAGRDCLHTELGPRRRGEARWHWYRGDRGPDEAERGACRAFAEAPPPPAKSGRRGAVWLAEGFVAKQREKGAAQKLWRAGYWLLFAGVAAPTPLALCTRAGKGVVFVRRIAAATLRDELAAGALDPDAVLAAARELGRSVGRLHAHGLRNRDLKFENLVRDPTTGRVVMVDLDGVRSKSVEDARGAGADLGRLLAAFRHAGSPGGDATVRTFVRAWLRSHRDLLCEPPVRRVLRRAAERAGEWAARHVGPQPN